MTTALPLAASDAFPVFVVFAVFVASTLLLAIWVTTDRVTPGDFYISDGRLTPARNGIALFGDYMSAATLLGSPGVIALTGYDGIPYLLGPIVAWVVMLLLVAEPYHSTGRFTIGDSLARRLRPRPVHRAAGSPRSSSAWCTSSLSWSAPGHWPRPSWAWRDRARDR